MNYRRKSELPIDQEERQEITIAERIQTLIEELPRERGKAKERIKESQEKQKKYHDQKIKEEIKFEIGDKILYFNAAKLKQWSGKLEEKWKGPYYIHEIMLNGSYRIKDLEGKIIKTPVNGKWLKKYKSRQNFIPYVVV